MHVESCRTLFVATSELAKEVGVYTVPVKRSRAALSRTVEGFLAVPVKRPLQAILVHGAERAAPCLLCPGDAMQEHERECKRHVNSTGVICLGGCLRNGNVKSKQIVD